MLKQRVITAVILAIVVVGTILGLDTPYVTALFAFVLLVSMQEYINLTLTKLGLLQFLSGVIVVALFYLSLPHIDLQYMFYLSFLGLILWFLILLYLFQYQYSGQWSIAMRVFVCAFSTVLIWICIHGLVFIHQHFAQGGWILMYVLTLVWVADIGAYFSGKRFGKNKLAPGISPGKTREGVAGGLVLNGLWITLVYALSGGWGMEYLPFLALGLITAAISVVGDLYESILKREADMKDSGKILPGHGGVLDRIDSVIAATPVYLSGLYVLGAI